MKFPGALSSDAFSQSPTLAGGKLFETILGCHRRPPTSSLSGNVLNRCTSSRISHYYRQHLSLLGETFLGFFLFQKFMHKLIPGFAEASRRKLRAVALQATGLDMPRVGKLLTSVQSLLGHYTCIVLLLARSSCPPPFSGHRGCGVASLPDLVAQMSSGLNKTGFVSTSSLNDVSFCPVA